MDTVTKKSHNFIVRMVKDYTCPTTKVTLKAGTEWNHKSIRLHTALVNGKGTLTHTEWVDTYPIDTDVKVPREYYKVYRREYVDVVTTTVTITEE